MNNYRQRRATITNDRSNCGHGTVRPNRVTTRLDSTQNLMVLESICSLSNYGTARGHCGDGVGTSRLVCFYYFQKNNRRGAFCHFTMDLETAYSIGGGGGDGGGNGGGGGDGSPSVSTGGDAAAAAVSPPPPTPAALNGVLHVLAALTAIPSGATSADADTAFANVVRAPGPMPALQTAAALIEKLYSVSPQQFSAALSVLSESNRNMLHEKLLVLAMDAGDGAAAASLIARTLYLCAARVLGSSQHLPEDARYGTSGVINDAYAKLASLAAIVRPDASNPVITAARTAAARATEAAAAASAKVNELVARMRARGLTPEKKTDPKLSGTTIALIIVVVLCVVVICVLGVLLVRKKSGRSAGSVSGEGAFGGAPRPPAAHRVYPADSRPLAGRSAFNDGSKGIFAPDAASGNSAAWSQ